jgi:2-(1,2-epoxy-1,2-dihydrophenyl)acetyl-CoA isomerase
MSDLVLSRIERGVAWITLNLPERKNAISPEMREELLAALDRAREDDEVRAVVITGAGDAFCAGADLARSTVTKPPDAEERRPDARATREAMRRGIQRIVRAIWELDKPVVAAVNGIAAGGGAQLALVCDLVIAASSARFVEIFVKRGLAVDSGGAYLLPRLVGLARAKELVFFGEPIDASEAQRIGLVNRVVPDAELASAAREWAEKLASGATRAIGASKLLMNRAIDPAMGPALEEEAEAQATVSSSEDFREGVKAFLEKRPPEFKGR